MKIIKTLLIGCLALYLFNSAALAQGTSAGFSLNQANQQLSLEQKDFETIYRTDQVPDTCYRDETRGYQNVCHTEYDRQCRYENYPYCTNIPRNVCGPVQQCSTRVERVCNRSGCVNIPRRYCQVVTRCTTRTEQVCRMERREICQNYPRQACIQVPIIVRVPYACTRPVQTPIGQRMKLHTVANLNITYANLNEVGPTADVLQATLNNGKVVISLQSSASYLYQIISQQRSEQSISATEKIVSYQFTIKTVSLQKLNEFLNAQIVNPLLFKDRLDFSFLGRMDVPFKGHLKLDRSRRVLSAIAILDVDFEARTLTTQGSVSHLNFSSFNIGLLADKTHSGEISLSIDTTALQQGLINPADLAQIAQRSVRAKFEGLPR